MLEYFSCCILCIQVEPLPQNTYFHFPRLSMIQCFYGKHEKLVECVSVCVRQRGCCFITCMCHAFDISCDSDAILFPCFTSAVPPTHTPWIQHIHTHTHTHTHRQFQMDTQIQMDTHRHAIQCLSHSVLQLWLLVKSHNYLRSLFCFYIFLYLFSSHPSSRTSPGTSFRQWHS